MTDHDGVPGTAVAAASWAPGWPVALEDDLDLALPIATDLNTYEHHEGVVRGERAERNGLKTITGDFGRLDRSTWNTLNAILEQPLPALTA